MASPTGPYEALVESDLCWPGSLGLIVRTEGWGFSDLFNNRSVSYKDGAVRIYALANDDLTRGVWVEMDAPPTIGYPVDTYGRFGGVGVGRVAWPLTITEEEVKATPTLVEPGNYIEAERPVFLRGAWYLRGFEWSEGRNEGFVGGPLRVRIGQGEQTAVELHGLEPMAGHEPLKNKRQALAAVLVYDPVGQMLSETQQVFVGIQVGWDFQVGLRPDNGYETTLPFVVTAEDLLGHPLETGSNDSPVSAFRHGVTLEFDAARGLDGYHNSPPVNFSSTPISCSLHQCTVHGNGRTNVFLPTGATGPNLNRFAYYGGHKGDRPDLHEPVLEDSVAGRPSQHYVDTYAVDGPHWHEDAIIHAGHELSQNGARQQFTLTFPPTPQSGGRQSEIDNIGFAFPSPFDGLLGFYFQPNFYWFVGGQTIDFLPSCAGRNLLPRMYASGFKQFPAVTISSVQSLSTIGTYPCDVDIQAMCHAFAFTRKLTDSGGLPGFKVVPGGQRNTRCGTDLPSSLPLVNKYLPLPGESGMSLDAFSSLTPTRLELERHTYEIGEQPGGIPDGYDRPFATPGFRPEQQIHNLGAVIEIHFNWWFKFSARRINLTSCNRVWYRSQVEHQRVTIPLSVAGCETLSAGDVFQAYSAMQGATLSSLYLAANADRFGGNPCDPADDMVFRNVPAGLFSIQFSIP
jgi:hypothetical protein